MKGLSDLIDSDVENSHDVLNSILSSSSDGNTPAAKATQAKKGKKRHRVTMPKPKARVAKTSPAPKKAAAKKPIAAKRKALEKQINQDESEEEVQETQAAKPRGRATVKPNAKAPAVEEEEHEEMEVDQTPATARSHFAPGKSSKTAPRVVPVEPQSKPVKKVKTASKPIVPEPQQEPMAEESELEEMQIEPTRQRNISRQNSRARQEPVSRRRAGSASDTERGDPNLRRKLGDITRKFENVDLKYRNLKEVGISEANTNMEKLRKQCEATTKASSDLIASLKQELATQAPLAQDARKIKKQMHTQETEMSNLRKTAADLTEALTAAQNEIKSLQAKLAAARASSVAVEGRTPARDAKKDVRPAPLPASEAMQVAQMKEELYSDLTGLIIRGVKRGEDGDTYDCIQTGRNGTLHFKLFMDAEEAKNASFEETDFLYTPLLDANRDRDMIDLLPEYLREEITFARQNAAKFYGRVLDTLTKKQVDA